jgi:deoxyhypusine synthase
MNNIKLYIELDTDEWLHMCVCVCYSWHHQYGSDHVDLQSLLDSYETTGFQGTSVGQAIRRINEMVHAHE